MSNGRHTKPLFELLRDESSEGRRPMVRTPSPGIPTPELKPARPAPTREAPHRDTPATSTSPATPAPSLGGGVFSMSVYGAYLGVAAVLATVVIIWVYAYNSGRQRAERDLGERVQRDVAPGVTDPRALVQTPRDPLADPPQRQPQPQHQPQPAPSPSKPEPAAPTTGPIAPGLFDADPRPTGQNYAVFATLPKDEAAELVAFLGKYGQDAVGILVRPGKQVDRSGKADNNQPLYKVASSVGITSDQYNKRDPARTRQEAEALRLGTLWKQSKNFGRRDFSSLYWEKP